VQQAYREAYLRQLEAVNLGKPADKSALGAQCYCSYVDYRLADSPRARNVLAARAATEKRNESSP